MCRRLQGVTRRESINLRICQTPGCGDHWVGKEGDEYGGHRRGRGSESDYIWMSLQRQHPGASTARQTPVYYKGDSLQLLHADSSRRTQGKANCKASSVFCRVHTTLEANTGMRGWRVGGVMQMLKRKERVGERRGRARRESQRGDKRDVMRSRGLEESLKLWTKCLMITVLKQEKKIGKLF